jgi:hypothetical protein
MPQLFLAMGCNCSWIDGISCLVCRLFFVQCVHSPALVFDKPPLKPFFLDYKCRIIHGRYYYFNKVYLLGPAPVDCQGDLPLLLRLYCYLHRHQSYKKNNYSILQNVPFTIHHNYAVLPGNKAKAKPYQDRTVYLMVLDVFTIHLVCE